MKIGIVGAGYVGLVTAAILGQSGHTLVLCEQDPKRRATLALGHVPVDEPGLSELWERLTPYDLVHTPRDIHGCDAIIVCVQTPLFPDGSIDLSHLRSALDSLPTGPAPVIVRSTVPPGTCAALQGEFPGMVLAHVPEFLVEGQAIHDAQQPSRVVLGAGNADVFALLRHLFVDSVPHPGPVFEVDWTTAELSKVGANVALASRVSLINALTRVAIHSGADATAVRRIIGADPRIGPDYFHPSLGFGGSCLPKDVAGLNHSAQAQGLPLPFLAGLHDDNALHTEWLTEWVVEQCPPNPTIAVWGLAFKAGVGDTRGSRSGLLIRQLLRRGAAVRTYDPIAELPDAWMHPRVTACTDPIEAAKNVDALVVATASAQWAAPPLSALSQSMRGRVVADCTFTWDVEPMRQLGWFTLGNRPQ